MWLSYSSSLHCFPFFLGTSFLDCGAATCVSSPKTFLRQIIDIDIVEKPCVLEFCFDKMIEVLGYKSTYLVGTKRPILLQLSLFYSPLNSCSDDSNHRSLQGKSPSSAGFKSFIFISLPYFSLHPCANRAITWPSFLLKTYACCHLFPHMILHLMAYFLLRNKNKDGSRTD